MNDLEFSGLSAAAIDSRVGRGVARGLHLIADAWTRSRVVAWVRTSSAGFTAWSAPGRLRFCAMTLGWAAVLHWAALAVIPRYGATGLPRGWFLGLAGVAWMIAGNAESVARAWSASRVAQILRRLVT